MYYNTDINIIGSIPDYHLIYRALPLLIDNPKELERILVSDNEFNFRTEKSRKRFLSVLNSAFISENKELNNITSILISFFDNDEKSQSLILFWLFSLNNKLFFDLNRDMFFKYFFQGRTDFPKEDVISYIKELIFSNEDLQGKWSEKTIDTIASKYLTVLKKMNLLEGRQRKKLCFVRTSDELLAVFVHIYSKLYNKPSNVLNDDLFQFSFVPDESLIERLKKIAKKDWIRMNFTGTNLKVEGVFNDKQIIDGIYR